MPHRTTARAVNPPHNRTCGTCGKRAVGGFFFFYQIYNENRNVFPKKRGVLMKNVYYLSVLVLKIQYTQKFEDKYKQNESLSSLSRLGWVIFFLMSHFQVSQDLDESFSSLSRLGWVIFKSRDLDESLSSLSRLGWVIFKSLETWMSHFQVSQDLVSEDFDEVWKEEEPEA